MQITDELISELANIELTWKEVCQLAQRLNVNPLEISELIREPEEPLAEYAEKLKGKLKEDFLKVDEILRVFLAHGRVWKRIGETSL